MNQKKKALLLSAICSLTVLSACGKKTVDIDGEQYYKVEDTYVKKSGDTKTFAPGEHVIYYSDGVDQGYNLDAGYQKNFNYPEIPEGYEYYDNVSITTGTSSRNYIVYMFINTKTVEVTGEYNPNTNEYVYSEPGKIVDTLTLENNKEN